MLFIVSLNFTDQGIRNIKDAPKRAQAAQELAKKCGCEIKQVYLTSGEYDLMLIERRCDKCHIQVCNRPNRGFGAAVLTLAKMPPSQYDCLLATVL